MRMGEEVYDKDFKEEVKARIAGKVDMQLVKMA